MNWQQTEPKLWTQRPGVAILEARPGHVRDDVVAGWLAQRSNTGARAWHLDCRPDEIGPWAGLHALIEDLLPAIREHAPDLLLAHSRELCLVVPALRSELAFPESLAEITDVSEQVRHFPADHAHRCLHGLIDLLSEWHERTGWTSWSIVLEDYDRATSLVTRFYRELVRRRGTALDVRLLLVVSLGAGDEIAEGFGHAAITDRMRLEAAAREDGAPSPESMASLAVELERGLEDATAPNETVLPRLIDAWRKSGSPERALPWQVLAMQQYDGPALYEASLLYAVDVERELDRLYTQDRALYAKAVEVLNVCYVSLGLGEAAVRIADHFGNRAEGAREIAHHCYQRAMLHARFLQPFDLDLAADYLRRGYDALEDGDVSETDRHFLQAFNMNALALVRLKQRRSEEALELCKAALARLDGQLDRESHRLFRSVLLLNIARVDAEIGSHEEALAYFDRAIATDPNYAELYNERGALYLSLGVLGQAERDFLRAIELSAPFAEVWTNLGQCHRAMERMEDAVSAYSRALDLDPHATLALVGRAEAYAELARPELALSDYDEALAREPKQPLVLAARAILHYENGRLSEALADLDAAVELAPEIPELYANRAVALRELGRDDEADRDLLTSLDLSEPLALAAEGGGESGREPQ